MNSTPEYTLFLQQPGRIVCISDGSAKATQVRRVEIHCAGSAVMDFVTVNKHRPTSQYPHEILLARRVLAFLNT